MPYVGNHRKMFWREFPNLSVIQSVGASIEHITNTQKIPKNTVVTRIVDDNLSNDMFEYVIGGIFYYLKDFPIYIANSKYKKWMPKKYKTIGNTTIGVLGLGKIGKHVATRIAALGFKVKAWSKSPKSINHIECFSGNNELSSTLSIS